MEKFDHSYIAMAGVWAQNSYCKRRQVGALLVKDRMIISDGYNGTPAGFENVCENELGQTKSYVLHAEANAITKVAKSNNSSEGATLYVTDAPCMECAKLIIQAGEGIDILCIFNLIFCHIQYILHKYLYYFGHFKTFLTNYFNDNRLERKKLKENNVNKIFCRFFGKYLTKCYNNIFNCLYVFLFSFFF